MDHKTQHFSPLLKTPPKPVTPSTGLQSARIIQATLVYLINLPESIADESLLRRYEYFGQYGSITKFVLSKSSQHGGTAYGAYVTYAREEEAAMCIKACHRFEIEGHLLGATYGTTKYCSFFINGKSCPKPNCMFLHALASDKNTMTRDVLPVHKHIQPDNALIDKVPIQVLPSDGRTVFPMARLIRDRIYSEQIDRTDPPARMRLMSKDISQKSRFEFIEDAGDEHSLCSFYKELYHSVSPSKEAVELNAREIGLILSPESPDRWAADLFEIRPRAFSDFVSIARSEDELILVAPKSNFRVTA